MIVVFLCLTSLSMIISRSIHVADEFYSSVEKFRGKEIQAITKCTKIFQNRRRREYFLQQFSPLKAAAAKSLQSCPTLQPHRQQPTRLPCPWDSPGKNIGVGCHFLLQCMKVKNESEGAQQCLTLSDPMDCSLPGSSIHGIFQARVLEWVAIAFSLCSILSMCLFTY